MVIYEKQDCSRALDRKFLVDNYVEQSEVSALAVGCLSTGYELVS